MEEYLAERFGLQRRAWDQYSPLTLAYIGDAVYDLIIRSVLVKRANCQTGKLHLRASSLVKAGTQAEMITALQPHLTEEEQGVYRRGHNAKPYNTAKRRAGMRYEELTIEGRNAVMEAFRSGKTIDKLYVQEGLQDGPVLSILREAKKHDIIINKVKKERLDQMSETGKHQGVIAQAAAYEYAQVEDILNAAREKGEPPFIILLDNIEDPHNLGAIIRTANLGNTIEELKKEGLWFVCADMDGELMYNLDLKGPIGLVVGNEGNGVSRLVKEKCDFVASIPMNGNIDSLNASVAAGVLAYEIVRQKMQ